MLLHPGFIYAWQGALGFLVLFNFWLHNAGTCFPVKPEKEGLLCSACCVCQILFLFLFLVLSYIKKLSNFWLLGYLCDSVCLSTKVYLTARPPHQSPLEKLFRTLSRAAGPAGRLTFTSAETWPSWLFASVTPLKRSPCGVLGIFFWTILWWTTLGWTTNLFSHQTTVCKTRWWPGHKTPTRGLRIILVTFCIHSRNHTKPSWKNLLEVILPFHQPPDRIICAEGDEIVISATAKAFPKEHLHIANHPSGAQVSQLENYF